MNGSTELTVRDVVRIIQKSVPEEMQEDWDNSGIQIGFNERKVNKILTCLEVTGEVINEAIDRNADMIVSHHPLIFGGISSIDSDIPLGNMILRLIQAQISVYSSHTPFDLIDGGNNDVMAELLGLSDVHTVSGDGFCKAGVLSEAISFEEFIRYTADRLDLDIRKVRAAGNKEKVITSVALCTGAGAEYAGAAARAGYDCLVTGDVKHHEALDAAADDFCIVDAGHYGTEKFFNHSMALRLAGLTGEKNVEIIESSVVTDPFIVL